MTVLQETPTQRLHDMGACGDNWNTWELQLDGEPHASCFTRAAAPPVLSRRYEDGLGTTLLERSSVTHTKRHYSRHPAASIAISDGSIFHPLR